MQCAYGFTYGSKTNTSYRRRNADEKGSGRIIKRRRMLASTLFSAALALFLVLVAQNCSYQLPAGASSVAALREYRVDEAALPAAEPDIPLRQRLLAECTLREENEAGKLVLREYDGAGLVGCLPQGSSITEVAEADGFLYITYLAADGKEVILTYTDQGLQEQIVYDVGSDTAIYETADGVSLYRNFRNGTPLWPYAAAFAVVAVFCGLLCFLPPRKNNAT